MPNDTTAQFGVVLKTQQHRIWRRFFDQAQELRAVFDHRFEDPLMAHRERFVWDFWHVPQQFTQLRTPAFEYFPAKLYQRFHRHLVEWGRAQLGCHDVSPPWLSCYVNGCRQHQHQDVPHGPLAFVYSLSPPRPRYLGGETFIHESGRILTIPARFNQLLVFNPSLVHGVSELKGSPDPREGRLVVHGWFVNPRPFWYGPLTAEQVTEGLDQCLRDLLTGRLDLGQGLWSLRLNINAQGSIEKLETLICTLRGGSHRDRAKLTMALGRQQFAKRRVSTVLTLPLHSI